MDVVTKKSSGVVLRLHIQPKAVKTEITGIHGDRLKIRLKAPPVDGKANAELIRFLSDVLRVPKNQVTITHGETGRQKTVYVEDLSIEDARSLLNVS